MDRKPTPPSLILTTDRLLLKPFAAEDVSELLAVFQNPGVRRYLLDDQRVDVDWVRDEVVTSAARFADSSAGLWAICRRGAASIVGFTGFRPFFEPPQLQLLYGLLPNHWGLGYATEAARAAIDFGFQHAGLDEVIAATDLPNVASVATMERLGMSKSHITDDGTHGTVFYRLAAPGTATAGRRQ